MTGFLSLLFLLMKMIFLIFPFGLQKEFIILTDCNEREYTRMEADFSRVLEEMNIMLPSGSVRLVPSPLFEQLDAWLKVTEEKNIYCSGFTA